MSVIALSPELIGHVVKIQIFDRISETEIDVASQLNVVGKLQAYAVNLKTNVVAIRLEGCALDRFDLTEKLVEVYDYHNYTKDKK